jgi:hypothetical protein
MTTVLGQIGGALGGKRALQRAVIETGQPQFRFRIAQLLWAGVWISLLLTAIRLTGIQPQLILTALVGWLACAAATLVIGGWLVRQLGPWWARRRQGRST